MDLGFILDSSGSVGYIGYQQEKAFIKSISARFHENQDGPIASVITYSFDADLNIKLNDYMFPDLASFNLAVDTIPYIASISRLDKALLLAQTDLYSLENGGRPDCPKVLIVLLDGVPTQGYDYVDPSTIAQTIRNSGIYTLFVAFGQEVSYLQPFLLQVAGNDNEDIFTVIDASQLTEESFIDAIISRAWSGMLFCG